MATFPKVKFEYGPRGVKATSIRPGPNGKRFRRITEAVVPTLRLVANPRVAQYGMVESMGWTLPMDDTHYRIYVAGRVKEKGELAKFKSRYNGKTWAELSPEEHQKFPGDTEAQVGQGAITFHSEEHLMSSDQGVLVFQPPYPQPRFYPWSRISWMASAPEQRAISHSLRDWLHAVRRWIGGIPATVRGRVG